MSLYLVIQEPKLKYRQALVILLNVIDAESRAHAIRIVDALDPPSKDYKATRAVAISNGLSERV